MVGIAKNLAPSTDSKTAEFFFFYIETGLAGSPAFIGLDISSVVENCLNTIQIISN